MHYTKQEKSNSISIIYRDDFSVYQHPEYDDTTLPFFDNPLQEKLIKSTLSSLSIFTESSGEASSSLSVQKRAQSEYKELLQALPWAYDFYTTAKDLDSSKKLLRFYKEINSLVQCNSSDEVNNFLFYIDTKHMSDVLLPGLLRLTFKKRNEIKCWHELKTRVSNELDERGYDASKVLRGLD